MEVGEDGVGCCAGGVFGAEFGADKCVAVKLLLSLGAVVGEEGFEGCGHGGGGALVHEHFGYHFFACYEVGERYEGDGEDAFHYVVGESGACATVAHHLRGACEGAFKGCCAGCDKCGVALCEDVYGAVGAEDGDESGSVVAVVLVRHSGRGYYEAVVLRELLCCQVHDGEVVAYFAEAASGHEGEVVAAGAQVVAVDEFLAWGQCCEACVHLCYGRVAHVVGFGAVAGVEFGLEGEDGEYSAHQASDGSYAPFFPCPHFGWDEVIDWDAERCGFFGYFEVEGGVVDEDECVRLCHFESVFCCGKVAAYFFYVFEYVDKTHVSHFGVMDYGFCSGLLFHFIAAEEGEVGGGIGVSELAYEVGGMKVAGGFAGYEEVVHGAIL